MPLQRQHSANHRIGFRSTGRNQLKRPSRTTTNRYHQQLLIIPRFRVSKRDAGGAHHLFLLPVERVVATDAGCVTSRVAPPTLTYTPPAGVMEMQEGRDSAEPMVLTFARSGTSVCHLSGQYFCNKFWVRQVQQFVSKFTHTE